MSVKVHEPVCEDSAQDLYFWFDHFLGDQLKDEWRTIVGGGSVAVVDAQTGGIVRFITGATTNDTTLMDWADIRSLLFTKKLTGEIRLKLAEINARRCFMNWRFDATNNLGFVYDSGISANWQIEGDDGGTTRLDSGIAADTDYHIFRVECHTHGASHAHFYIDGVETANSPLTTNLPDDATDYLQPWIFQRTLEDVAKTIDVDYVVARQER